MRSRRMRRRSAADGRACCRPHLNRCQVRSSCARRLRVLFGRACSKLLLLASTAALRPCRLIHVLILSACAIARPRGRPWLARRAGAWWASTLLAQPRGLHASCTAALRSASRTEASRGIWAGRDGARSFWMELDSATPARWTPPGALFRAAPPWHGPHLQTSQPGLPSSIEHKPLARFSRQPDTKMIATTLSSCRPVVLRCARSGVAKHAPVMSRALVAPVRAYKDAAAKEPAAAEGGQPGADLQKQQQPQPGGEQQQQHRRRSCMAMHATPAAACTPCGPHASPMRPHAC